jgi:hypothetical protein
MTRKQANTNESDYQVTDLTEFVEQISFPDDTITDLNALDGINVLNVGIQDIDGHRDWESFSIGTIDIDLMF